MTGNDTNSTSQTSITMGLDISSTFTGWSLVYTHTCGAIAPPTLHDANQIKMGTGELYIRSIRFFDILLKILQSKNIDKEEIKRIVIEDTLLRHHRSNAKTLKTINQINAMITFGCSIYFPNATIEKVSVQKSRKSFLEQMQWKNNTDIKDKEWIKQNLKDKYRDEIQGSNKWRDDATDAIVLGFY